MPEQPLNDVLRQLAETLTAELSVAELLGRLVRTVVDALPVDAAGITLISDTGERPLFAASAEIARRSQQLQSELGEGPCLAAHRSGEPVSCPDLRAEDRFDGFTPRAVDAGLTAVFTFPLCDGHRSLGALALYRATPGVLDHQSTAAAASLAEVIAAYVANARTRADLLTSSERAHDLSLHDALTGLTNRTLLMERLRHAIARTTRSRTSVAVMFIDLDHFKQVNDRFGHQAGDELLVAVAHRITGLLRPGDTLARMSGDEFVVLCEQLDDPAQALWVASRIRDAFRTPFALRTAELRATASIGVALTHVEESESVADPHPRDQHQTDQQRADQLMREADTAMYQVKRGGGDGHGIFDEELLRGDHERLDLGGDLQAALESGRLHPEYQPVLTTRGQRIVGAEALLRWSHPTLGALGPATFIPLAEQTGLILDLGRAVLELACGQLAEWVRDLPGADRLAMAVNVSPHQLVSPDFVDVVREVLDATGADPGSLTLEFTEVALGLDRGRLGTVLTSLRRLGVRLALDNFGVGGASLLHLRDLPVDVVKIDRSFVTDLRPGTSSRLIVAATVGLCHDLGIGVVAQGVETAQQHAAVLELGCDHYQGHHFAPSVPPAPYEQLLAWTSSRAEPWGRDPSGASG